MATGVMFIVMFGLMFLGVPIAVAMFISMFVLINVDPVTTSSFIAQTTYGGVASFTNLALPFFMISGTIMETGGLSKRLVSAANSIIGGVTGSLGMVTVIACMFFGAVSGSAPATVAAIGAIMIPMMVQEGYSKYYATALACCAGGLGVIVPPSYPLVLYGVTCNQSVGDLFIAGLLPSCVVGGVLILINYVYCRKHRLKGENHFHIKSAVSAWWDAKWALIMPVIILGGIYGGFFTATEAAVVAVVYGIFIGFVVYRELKIEKLWAVFRDNAAFIAGTMFIMCPAKATGSVFAYLNINQTIADFMFSISSNYYVVMFMIFIIMFIVGMFIQTTPAIIILAPTLGMRSHSLWYHPGFGPGYCICNTACGNQPVCGFIPDRHQYRQDNKGRNAPSVWPDSSIFRGGIYSGHFTPAAWQDMMAGVITGMIAGMTRV